MPSPHRPPGSFSVELWRWRPQPRWAVVRWQSGPCCYLPVVFFDSEEDAWESLVDLVAAGAERLPLAAE